MSGNSLNLCQFIGRLGSDPTITSLPSGGTVANLSLAVDWKTKEKDGVEWVRVVAFNKLAEIIEKYVKKGQQVFVSGSLRTRKWEDKDGNTRYSTEIVANQMQMLGGKRDNGQDDDGDFKSTMQTPPAGAAYDDDIPF